MSPSSLTFCPVTIEANKIFVASRKVLEDFVKLNQKLVNNNVATKDVIYSAEYEVSKLDQQVAVNIKNQESTRAYFNFLLNKELNSEVVADSGLTFTISFSSCRWERSLAFASHSA